MPALANIVLPDGTATPVNVTFTPSQVTDALKVFADRRLAYPSQQPTVSYSFKAPGTSGSAYSNDVRINLPHVRTVGGVDVVDSTSRAFVAFKISPNASALERAHLIAFTKSALANALIAAGVKDLDPLWG